MIYVKSAEYVQGYEIKITFNNDTVLNVDLRDQLKGPIFVPLQDPDVFKKFQVHPDLETLTWENGADFSPEFLYELGTDQARRRA